MQLIMTSLFSLIVILLLLLILAITTGLRRVTQNPALRMILNSVTFLAQSGLIAWFAFFCLVCFIMIKKIAIHNQSYFALPFINITGALLVFPLLLLLLKSFLSNFTTRRTTSIKSHLLYLVTLPLYLLSQHVGLVLLGMSVIPNPMTYAVMAFLALLSTGFSLYTYRQYQALFV